MIRSRPRKQQFAGSCAICYAYGMAQRTALALSPEARKAATQLAQRHDCSLMEAVSRAVQRQRDAEIGPTSGKRRARRQTLARLYELFEGHDAAAEVARLKLEDESL